MSFARIKQKIRSLVPSKYMYILSHLRNQLTPGGFAIHSYSGDGEDIALTQMLFKKQQEGFYVDVGAFHPKHISNTYLLHKRGWSGINIDPNPEAIALFKRYRPKDTNLQMGVAIEETTLPYFKFSHAGINTFDADHAEKKGAKEWNQLLGKEDVVCKPLATIFTEFVPPGTTIDMLDVDVEGMDLEVLQSNDWDKYPPRVVLVEDLDFFTKPTDTKIYQYLVGKGYVFHAFNGITLIMKQKDFVVS